MNLELITQKFNAHRTAYEPSSILDGEQLRHVSSSLSGLFQDSNVTEHYWGSKVHLDSEQFIDIVGRKVNKGLSLSLNTNVSEKDFQTLSDWVNSNRI